MGEQFAVVERAAVEQRSHLERMLGAWQDEAARRSLAMERNIADLQSDRSDGPLQVALKRSLPEVAVFKELREHSRDLAKGVEAVRQHFQACEERLLHRLEVLESRGQGMEGQGRQTSELHARTQAQTRLRLEEVAREHSQRLSLAELMHQRLEGRLGAVEGRLQPLEGCEGPQRAFAELNALQQRVLNLVDGAEAVLCGGGRAHTIGGSPGTIAPGAASANAAAGGSRGSGIGGGGGLGTIAVWGTPTLERFAAAAATVVPELSPQGEVG
mmetsp:Transcript_1972/g.7502  ORF Transcript_1972/g.7502 Transcript_1972/m.7502 type:complete len:271 (-) Transcript_1972:268-1080(-)